MACRIFQNLTSKTAGPINGKSNRSLSAWRETDSGGGRSQTKNIHSRQIITQDAYLIKMPVGMPQISIK